MTILLSLCIAFAPPPASACASCHPKIVRDFAQTPMARTSGKVIPADHSPAPLFTDPTTQIEFSLTRSPQAFLLHFERPQLFTGSRQLTWFLGSGRVGRSYLFSDSGQFFQAPVSWYSNPAHWQLSPGFDRRPLLDLTRAVEPSCLQCHASNVTKTAMDPGVTCERCHGPSKAHATAGAKIVNPRKLAPEERDSVCAQCHLTGVARVAKFREDGDAYTPGKRLSLYSTSFLAADAGAGNAIGVTSHFEKLAASKCKLGAGDALTCITCHNPHNEPEPQQVSRYYRERCQSCHATQPCTKAPQGDCIACHMPKAAGRGVDHSSYTDHSIPRSPRGLNTNPSTALSTFWKQPASERDLGLAYAILNRPLDAQPLLEKSLNPKDAVALAQLAQIHDRQGREAQALPLYEAAHALDARNTSVATNLAVLKIKAGQVDEAIALWREALAINPALTGARMNLAMALNQKGDRATAIKEIETALRYDPDQPGARRLLQQLR